MKLQDKVAIVTGGGSGQGRAVSMLFAKEGASIAVADINEEGGLKTVDIITSAGGKATFVPCNVAKQDEVVRLIEKTLQTFGRVDILYNNAARNRPDSPIPEIVGEMPDEQWLETINTNLTGYYYTLKHVLPHMVKQGGGAIINVASTLGLGGSENQAAYSASKHGVMGLTKCTALDYGPKGIRVNAICPGAINTPRLMKHQNVYVGGDFAKRLGTNIPLRRIGEPEEIAKVALFLASDDSSFITGTMIPVDGGSAAGRLQ